MLMGGPADGRIVEVEHDQMEYRYLSVPTVKWRSTPEIIEPVAPRTDIQTVYSPRRRGDYTWYAEGMK